MYIPFPNKKYNCIYLDPPWHYRDKANAGNRGAIHKYPVMTLNEIKAMPVSDIADVNCSLFLWVTAPFLNHGIEVINAFGFSYKTVAFTWIKQNQNGSVFRGMGHYTRANAEFCLLGTKGRVTVLDHSVSSVVISKRRQHSRKPDEVRERISKLIGDVPKIELFARQDDLDGWDAWGLEVDMFNGC